MRSSLLLVLVMASVTGTSVAAHPLGRYAAEADVLPVERAFPVTVQSLQDGRMAITWDMPPGYYLYRSKISVTTGLNDVASSLQMPAAAVIDDPFLGRMEVYNGRLMVVVPAAFAAKVPLTVRFQGCEAGRICYPPFAVRCDPSVSSICRPVRLRRDAAVRDI